MPSTIEEIELKKVRPCRLNPRLEIGLERLHELASSIKEVGLLEPIIVRPVDNEFEVVVGERRYRASQEAGLEKVPAIIRNYSDDEVVQLNLIENVQREELSAVEKGKVCKYLLEMCPEKYPSQSVIAGKIGVSSNTVSSWLRTVDVVPQEVQKYVAPSTIGGEVPEGKIDYSTAIRVGRSVSDAEKRIEVIKRLAEEKLPAKERTQIIKQIAREPDRSIDEVIDEVVETPFQMRFAAIDRDALLDGTKTQASMTNIPDAKVKAGAVVHATIFEPHVADLQITSIERKRLKYYDEEDAQREGGYTLAEFKKTWKETHGEWDENTLVYVVHFKKAEQHTTS